MTDDIVTRLRKQFSNEFVIEHPHMVRVPTLYEEAADEIELLRKYIALLSLTVEMQTKELNELKNN